MENILTNEEGNDLITTLIEKGDPFGVSRIGIGEIHLIFNKITNNLNSNDFRSLNIGGVRSDSYDFFFEEYSKGITDADINVYWTHDLHHQQKIIFNTLSPKSTKVMNRSVEPFYFENPWSRSLENKKVLIINPFTDTIKTQKNKLWLVWGNRKIMPKFELRVLKTPFLNNTDSPSWKDVVNEMKESIDDIDFDIALLGCSLFGLPLVSYIKSIGKQAIYIGGGVQLLFGIKGKRWDTHPDISTMYNNHWVRPSNNDKPNNYNGGDGYTYW